MKLIVNDISGKLPSAIYSTAGKAATLQTLPTLAQEVLQAEQDAQAQRENTQATFIPEDPTVTITAHLDSVAAAFHHTMYRTIPSVENAAQVVDAYELADHYGNISMKNTMLTQLTQYLAYNPNTAIELELLVKLIDIKAPFNPETRSKNYLLMLWLHQLVYKIVNNKPMWERTKKNKHLLKLLEHRVVRAWYNDAMHECMQDRFAWLEKQNERACGVAAKKAEAKVRAGYRNMAYQQAKLGGGVPVS